MLAGHADRHRVAYVGHSFGGTTALEACHQDPGCTAAANLDGAIHGAVARDGLRVPSLLVGHDGSCIPGTCAASSPDDRGDVAAARAFTEASSPAPRRATVAGTGAPELHR